MESKNTISYADKYQSITLSQHNSTFPIEEMERASKIDQALVREMFDIFKQEVEHRQNLENRELEIASEQINNEKDINIKEQNINKLGIILGFLIILIILISIVILALYGHKEVAIAITTVGGIILAWAKIIRGNS